MKKLVCLIILTFAAAAFAAPQGMMEKDSNGYTLQGGAPNGLLAQAITSDTTIDLTSSLWWSFYAASDCRFRVLPTSAKGAYPQDTAIGGTRTSFLVNKLTPFLNLSGCTGTLQRQ